MKNILLLIMILIIPHSNIKDNYQEEARIIRNDKGLIEKVNMLITIENDLKELIINPKIFATLRNYKKVEKGDWIEINIIINNKTKKNYQYVKNSFRFETDNFSNDRSNYRFTKIKGFDGKRINKVFSYKENNTDKEIKEAYDYFYQEVLDVSVVKENIVNIKENDKVNILKIIVKINDDKYKDIYENYNYYGKTSFKLKNNLL